MGNSFPTANAVHAVPGRLVPQPWHGLPSVITLISYPADAILAPLSRDMGHLMTMTLKQMGQGSAHKSSPTTCEKDRILQTRSSSQSYHRSSCYHGHPLRVHHWALITLSPALPLQASTTPHTLAPHTASCPSGCLDSNCYPHYAESHRTLRCSSVSRKRH